MGAYDAGPRQTNTSPAQERLGQSYRARVAKRVQVVRVVCSTKTQGTPWRGQ